VTDPAAPSPVELRPITDEEWPAFTRAMFDTFGEEPPAAYLDGVPGHAELDRSLAMWDGDRVVATAGLYSRELTVPGRVVPCAGVTWVSVAPSHRRRGVLTALMRRQLEELHEQQREPVAALWAVGVPIYGRFGYAPATWRGGPVRRGGAAAAAARRRPRHRAGRPGSPSRTTGPPSSACTTGLRRTVPGDLARDDRWWDRQLRDDPDQRRGASARRHLLHTEADGAVTGYAAYRVRAHWTTTGSPTGRSSSRSSQRLPRGARRAVAVSAVAGPGAHDARSGASRRTSPLRHLLAEPRALRSQPSTRCGCGWSTSAARWPPAATPPSVDLVIEVRDPPARGTTAAGGCGGTRAGAFGPQPTPTPDLGCDVGRWPRPTSVASRWRRCRRPAG
jgi:predicted N-acetyltransferase YhbS